MTSNADGQPASDGASGTNWEALGITPLMRAARSGDLDACAHLLGFGATVDTADDAGWTALMGASAEGHERIVQLLIGHGADLGAESFDTATALHAAIAYGHAVVVRLLLGAGAECISGMHGIGPFGGGGWWDGVKLAANNGDGETLQLLAEAGARLVDHDAALYLYRAYAVMGREVKLHRKGQTETYQSHDDAFYHPDVFTVGSPFQLPVGTPPSVLKLIHVDNTGCSVPVTGDRDTTAPVAFFGTRPADGSIATFEARGEGKPDDDPYGYGNERAQHLNLGGWRVHGYSLVLEELLHKGALGSQETTELLSRLLQVAVGVGKLEIVRELLRRGAIPPKGFQDLIETVLDPYWKIPDSTSIKRLLLARIVAPGFFEEPIERLKLSPRTLNALKRANVTNLGQVFDMSDDELLQIRNFGEKSLPELKNQLEPLLYEHDEMPPADD
jgi:hypothetical protein